MSIRETLEVKKYVVEGGSWNNKKRGGKNGSCDRHIYNYVHELPAFSDMSHLWYVVEGTKLFLSPVEVDGFHRVKIGEGTSGARYCRFGSPAGFPIVDSRSYVVVRESNGLYTLDFASPVDRSVLKVKR